MSTLLLNIYTGDTSIADRFQRIVDDEHKNFDALVVNFYEPGFSYERNGSYMSFVDLIKDNLDKPNVTYYGCNFSNEVDLPLYFMNNMFHEGQDLYIKNKVCNDLLAKCVDVDKKATDLKRFDFLMGGTTPTKDFVYDLLGDHPVAEQTFLTYYRNNPRQGSWSEHVKVPVNHTAETIDDKWKSMVRYSDLIDPVIYNSTFYTALIETVSHSDFGVFTEKTAKPIVAKRPFVVFGSPGQLKALHGLGFKTFSKVLDESYDDEQDQGRRYRMVLDAMNELCKENPVRVYEQLADVLEHNKMHFETTDWNREFRQKTMKSKKVDLFRFAE